MTPSLMARVAWKLTSTLAFVSMLVSGLLLVEGILKGVAFGVSSLYVPNRDASKYEHKIDPLRVSSYYLLVIFVTYFPSDDSVYNRSIYVLSVVLLALLAYFVFFKKYSDSSAASKIFAPVRRPEIGLRAVVAGALFTSYLMGVGFARAISSEAPVSIQTHAGEVSVVVIDNADAGFLVESIGELSFIPMHQIKKVTWREAE
ncbi:hypothetical protein [Ketogulonicigenium vulgare]|uniref:hypothetical protein n=1 Tax=Ketogulonicigenium vulgare TaxID=92945 RepID=UPI002358BEA0|nr:hypothetical protein [Ketogulonicigenium vulgare]